MSRERKLMSIKIPRQFYMIKRRVVRVYNEMFAIIKKNYDDDIFMNALIKNIHCVARVRKKIEQCYYIYNMIVAINHVTYHRANIVNAKMQQF